MIELLVRGVLSIIACTLAGYDLHHYIIGDKERRFAWIDLSCAFLMIQAVALFMLPMID